MPRGRKGSPQESVDSILLAVSRRDDIDEDTMSHYIDRLDEEWAHGARDKVLHLLYTHDAAAHTAAVLILSQLATDFDLEELEDIVADPRVTDVAKLSLATVLKQLDSEMADDGLIDYLNDPDTAMQQMQRRLLDVVGQSELGVEAVLEDVLEEPLEHRLGFVSWLGNSYDPRAASFLIPLLENSNSKLVMAVIDALERLGTLISQQSIPALSYIVSHAGNRQVKEHARAVLGRLTMQSELGFEDTADGAQGQLLFNEARVSFLDGTGSQMIMLSWQRPDGLLKGVNILYQDELGIKDCFGTDDMDAQRWTELVEEMEEQGYGSFSVPLEYGRALIAEARAISKRARQKLPIAYSIWRPFIEGDEPSRKNASSPSVLTQLEPIDLTPEVIQLAQQGANLYQRTDFDSWLFLPLDRLQTYIDRFWSRRMLQELHPASRKTTRHKRKGSRHEAGLTTEMERIITDALVDVIDDAWRRLYETRLLRQAALFTFAGRDEDVKLVRAVAALLRPDSAIPVQEQAFLRAMMRRSLEQGPLRAIAAAIEAGKLGPIPFSPSNE